jgi:hypothetical protein
LANALMKAETKAKRRATLSICGLGMLDETEVEDIQGAQQTLPKKDAKPIYTKLQAEIDAAETAEALQTWGTEARDRIAVLPHDWQDMLRLRFQERIVELRQFAQRPVTPSKQDAPALAAPALDSEAAIAEISKALQAITDPATLEATWNEKIAPIVDKMDFYDAGEALGLYRKREAELEP